LATRAAALSLPLVAFWDELCLGADRVEAASRAVTRSIAIGDVTLSLRFATPEIAATLFPAFAHVEAPAVTAPDITVRFWDSVSTGAARVRSPLRPGMLVDRGVVAGGEETSIRILCEPEYFHYSAWNSAECSAVVWADDVRRLGGHERASPIRAILQWALEPHEVFLIHGACVAGSNSGVLIGGLSGAGKSTTAIACLEGGLSFLGDDYVALAGHEPRALSLYASAKLDDHSVGLLGGLPDVARGIAVGPPFNKNVLMLGESRSDMLKRETPVGAIVVPARDAPPGLTPAPAALALRELAAPSVLQIPHEGAGTLRRLAALVRDVPAFRLGLSGGPEHAATDIGALCESLGGET
jgi:hypothetical protein